MRFTVESEIAQYGLKPRTLGWLLAVSGVGLLTPNPWVTMAALAVVPVLFQLLWRSGEPPTLLFAVGLQWLQVVVPIFQADIAGLSLDSPPLPELAVAAWLGLFTILVLAAGIRFGAGQRITVRNREIDAWGKQIDRQRLIVAYVVAFLASFVFNNLSARFPSIAQILLAVAAARWAVVFLILWMGGYDKRFRILALAVGGVETILGFSGYFSGFKFVFYLALLALLAKREGKVLLFRPAVAVVGLVLVLLAVYWQAVKVEYRTFLNQGTGLQDELVPTNERYAYLANRVGSVGREELQAGVESGLERMGYITYLAESIARVPLTIPYQEGRLWLEAVQHVLTPRVLFPEKGEVLDSLRTAEFAGDYHLAAAYGTTVSLGYAAESYIDFGPVLMFVPIFLVGLFWGRGYRFLATRQPGGPLVASTAIVFVMSYATLFETSNVKLLGGGLMALIVWTLVLRYAGAPAWRLLTPKRRKSLAWLATARSEAADSSEALRQPPVS